MQVTPSQWGNSLGIRLPKEIVKQVGIEKGVPLEMTVQRGKIVLATPKSRPKYTIEELMEGVKIGELQAAWIWGPDVGREIIDD